LNFITIIVIFRKMKHGLDSILKNKLILAPMEDVTEPSFRLICKKLGADIVFSEFISSEGLIREAKKAVQKLLFYEEERPVGIQIIGANEESMSEAGSIVESFNPDFIDINCGCWVKDVALRGAGAGLLRDLPKMRRIIEAVVKNVKLPVTVKTRPGWDSSSIVLFEIIKILEETGIAGLILHCRLRNQANKGEADWNWIKKIKDKGIKIPVILNGNVKTPEDVKTAFEKYEPDAVMIGQAAIDNPWIFRQSKFYLKHGYNEPLATPEERIEICLEHLRLSVEHKGEKYGVMEFRKHYKGYFREIRNISSFRMELMKETEYKPIEEKLLSFKEKHKLN